MHLFPFDRQVEIWIQCALPLVCLVAVAAQFFLRARGARVERLVNGTLIAAALLALLASSSEDWRRRSYFNAYVFFHYYMGAKYSPEVSYAGLYDAAWLAQHERSLPNPPDVLRDLATGELKPAARVLEERARIQGAFTPERWDEFCEDVTFFRHRLNRRAWGLFFVDKGYNGAPVWTLIGGSLARAVPTSSALGMGLLAWLDVFLMAGALASVWWAFDLRAMLLLLVFLCSAVFAGYDAGHPHLRAAFLRADWIVALITSVSLLKRGHAGAAGMLTGIAALVRVFPILLLFGIAAQAAVELLRGRRLERAHGAYLAGFVGALLLLGLPSLFQPGLAEWRAFGAKMFEHDPLLGVGFRRLLPEEGSYGLVLRALGWVIQASVLGACALAARRVRDHEALVLGVCLLFFLLTPAYYYYVVMALPLLFFAGRLESRAGVGGLVLLFGLLPVARWATRFLPDDPRRFSFTLSVLMALVLCYLLFLALGRAGGPSPVAAGQREPA